MDSQQLLDQLRKFSRQRIIESDKRTLLTKSNGCRSLASNKSTASQLNKLDVEEKRKLVLVIQRLALLEKENRQLLDKIDELAVQKPDNKNVSCQNSIIAAVDHSVQAVVEEVKSFAEYKDQARQRLDSYSMLAKRRQMDSFENSILLPENIKGLNESSSSIKSTGFHKFMECILNESAASDVSAESQVSLNIEESISENSFAQKPLLKRMPPIFESKTERQTISVQTDPANGENLNSDHFENSIPFVNDTFISVSASRNYLSLPVLAPKIAVEGTNQNTTPVDHRRINHDCYRVQTRSFGTEELYKQFAQNYEMILADDESSLSSSFPDMSSSIAETEKSISSTTWFSPVNRPHNIRNTTSLRKYENDERDIDIILGLFNGDFVYSANSIRR